MDVSATITATTSGGFVERAVKWLLNLDYDKVRTEDVRFRFLGMPEGWGLLVTVVCVAALIWLTFALYKREGRAASRRRKLLLAVIRTAAVALALILFLEPTLLESRVRETLSTVVVLLDTSESITIDDLYSDRAAAEGVAAATGLGLDEVLDQRIARQQVLAAAIDNPKLDLLNRLARKNPVQVYTFAIKPEKVMAIGRPVTPANNSSEGAPDDSPARFKPGDIDLKVSGGRTYMGRAMNAALEAAGGQPLAAIIVFSDGQDNDPDLDATTLAGEYAAREGVPVFAVPVGLAKSPKTKNIKLEKSLQANRTLFVGDPAEFVALVSSSGYQNLTVKAELYRQKAGRQNEQKVAEKEVVIEANAADQPISLTHTPLPGEEGEYIYTVRVGPLEDEHLRRDNVAVASGVRVVKTATNVLLIGGSPTWEYRFVKNLLVHDKTVTLSCWLQSAGKAYPQVGNRLLKRLPRTRKEIFDPDNGYHVIILMDIDPTDFDVEWFNVIKEFVDQRAGGLLYVAGEKAKCTYALFQSNFSRPLVKMLPVELDLGRARLAVGAGPKGARAWPLRPTEDGLSSPLLKFSTEREVTERIWQSLPGVVWTFPIKKAKPGATVLMRTIDPGRSIYVGGKNEPMPVLVTGFYGSGRVAFMAFDETWRWRRLGTRVYDTFWMQLVRSLVEGRLMGGKKSAILETDGETYSLGAPVTLSAKVFDASGKPARLPSVSVKIEMTGGGPESGRETVPPVTVRLMPVPGAPGTYKLQHVLPRTGYYRLSLVGPSGGGAGATTTIEVASQFEFDHPEANRVRLAELTDAAVGGGIVELKDLAALPGRIKSKKKQIVEPGDRFPLWANPLALGLMTVLLGTEWALRKRSNMA